MKKVINVTFIAFILLCHNPMNKGIAMSKNNILAKAITGIIIPEPKEPLPRIIDTNVLTI